MKRLQLIALLVLSSSFSFAGPYTERGVAGFVDSSYRPSIPQEGSRVNPIFRAWATGATNYQPADTESNPLQETWKDILKTLGPVAGDYLDVASLGDLAISDIESGVESGVVTLTFGLSEDPADPNDVSIFDPQSDPQSCIIKDQPGYDFVVFENSLVATIGSEYPSQIFAELAYVEVSSNGKDFVRFPSVSLTSSRVGGYDHMDVTNIYNLAGKHPNGNQYCQGTPFDLADLVYDPLVINGTLDLNNVRYVRVVDIPGNGSFKDSAYQLPDPATFDPNEPDIAPDFYASENKIFDPWITWGSGGFDLEAIGVLHPQEFSADINLDGAVNMLDLVVFANSYNHYFGQSQYLQRCDIAQPQNYVVDENDLIVFALQWLEQEQWRIEAQ